MLSMQSPFGSWSSHFRVDECLQVEDDASSRWGACSSGTFHVARMRFPSRGIPSDRSRLTRGKQYVKSVHAPFSARTLGSTHEVSILKM
jgi:hypothetical protein